MTDKEKLITDNMGYVVTLARQYSQDRSRYCRPFPDIYSLSHFSLLYPAVQIISGIRKTRSLSSVFVAFISIQN